MQEEKDREALRDDITEGLTLLGREVRQPVRKLETFPNQHPGRRYTVTLVCPEFTCICPVTGQPDFATITIRYIPDRRILESKSLKLYLWSYRQEGAFHEHVTNQILDDLVEALDPTYCHVSGAFNVRGGISITVDAEYEKSAV
jgi:7-cyano-7-deazaguanine reductase